MSEPKLDPNTDGNDASLDLKAVLHRLKTDESKDTDSRMGLLEELGNRSRNPDSRLAFFHTGLLEYILDQLDPEEKPHESYQILRVVGNCCADTDDVRAFVLHAQERLSFCIEHEALAPIAILCLFNLCNDYEPAQKAIATTTLVQRLQRILSNGIVDSDQAAFSPAIEILHWTVTNLGAENLSDGITAAVFRTLVDLSPQCDVPDFGFLVAICDQCLKKETFGKTLCDRDLFGPALDLFQTTSQRMQTPTEEMDEDDLAALRSHEISLMNHLADIASQDQFPQSVSLDHPVVGRLQRWILEGPDSLRTIACLILGNIAISDEACINMIGEMKIHEDLIPLFRSEDNGLRFAAAGFLRHLAKAPANKPALEELGLVSKAIDSLVLIDHDQVACAGIQLLRQMAIDSFGDTQSIALDSRFSKILSLVSKPRIGVDLGRLRVSMSRSLDCSTTASHSTDPEKIIDIDWLVRQSQVAESVLLLVRQENVALISEGWFGLSLIARTQSGSECLVHAFRNASAFGKLQEPILPSAVETAGQQSVPQVFLDKTAENAKFTAASLLSQQEALLQENEKEIIKTALRRSAER